MDERTIIVWKKEKEEPKSRKYSIGDWFIGNILDVSGIFLITWKGVVCVTSPDNTWTDNQDYKKLFRDCKHLSTVEISYKTHE